MDTMIYVILPGSRIRCKISNPLNGLRGEGLPSGKAGHRRSFGDIKVKPYYPKSYPAAKLGIVEALLRLKP